MWTLHELEILSDLVGQVNVFGDDNHDEFLIQREDGRSQGVFKSWAVPVIPLLEFGGMQELVDQRVMFQIAKEELELEWEERPWHSLDLVTKAREKFRLRCLREPHWLSEVLEHTRLWCWLLDRELTTLFCVEPLSQDPCKRVAELVNRLHLAFGLMNPFFNLEALCGDPSWLGSDASCVSTKRHTTLDVVPFFLPAAFRGCVIAETGDWHGLNWSVLQQLTSHLLTESSPMHKKVLLNLVRMLEVPVEHIVFAANALQFIPRRVGGKKDDPISEEEALRQIEAVVCNAAPAATPVEILAEMNARIRFHNWMPLIPGPENFQGLNWTYASTCDTSSLLLETLLQNPEVWEPSFAPIFADMLAPQLRDLDATSAKGRFLLHLILRERRLRKGLEVEQDKHWQDGGLKWVMRRLKTLAIFSPTHTIHPQRLVGGKPHGLALTSHVLGSEHVLPGFVIPTTDVERMLAEENSMRRVMEVENLNRVVPPDDMIKLLPRVRSAIEAAKPRLFGRVPQCLEQFPEVEEWAVRSSSLDEGTARGLHETLLRVPRDGVLAAVIACIQSFFSEKAVLFRLATKQGSMPGFAVLLQPFVEGPGGVAEVRDGKCQITCAGSADLVTSGGSGAREFACDLHDEVQHEIAPVLEALRKLSAVFGDVQIEWAVTPEGLKISQLELLARPLVPQTEQRLPTQMLDVPTLADMERVAIALQNTEESVALVLHDVDLDAFQGPLFSLIVRFGHRIVQIRLQRPVSPSSHFANICRHFGISLLPV